MPPPPDRAPATPAARAAADERALVSRLRAGDEAAFVEIVRALGPGMLRVARLYVRSEATAEEVVQETWIKVLRGLDRFEGRSSLRTWVLTVLVHAALRRGHRERRSAPFSSVVRAGGGADTFELDRFLSGAHPRWPGNWATVVPRLDGLPVARLLAEETVAVVRAALAELPEAQAAVLLLHDVEGWEPAEICAALQIAESNRRVLLHRARNRVRSALERYFREDNVPMEEPC